MSMEMDMVFDGRAGDPNVLNDAARKKIAAFLVDRIGDFRCPDHQKAPTVKVTGTSLEDVTFDVTACCSKCIQMTEDKLSE